MHCLKRMWMGGLAALAVSLPAFRIAADDPVDTLVRELRRADVERDHARKDLLRVQSDSKEATAQLLRQRRELADRLDRKSKEILTLEAAVHRSALAAEQARRELESTNRTLQKLEGDRMWTQKKYEQVLERVEALTDSASAGEVETLTRQRDRLRDQLRRTSEEMRDLRDGRGEVADEERTLRDQNRELSASLDAARRDQSLANAKVDALESRIDHLRDELARQYEERSRMEQENERQRRDIEDLRSELSNALDQRVPLEEVQPLRERMSIVEQERDLLAGQKKTLDRQLDRTTKNLENERKTRQRLSGENATLRRQARAERDRAREMEKDVKSLRSALDRAEASGIDASDLADAHRLLEDMKEENRELKDELEQQRGSVDHLMRELTEKENERNLKLRDLQNMLGEQLNELADARKRIQHLQRVENELELVREQRSTLVQRQHATHRDMKVLARHIRDLRAKVRTGEAAEADLERERRRSRGLSHTIQDLRRELTNLERVVEVVGQEKNRHQSREQELRRQLRQREAQQRRLEAENIALERQLRKARSD